MYVHSFSYLLNKLELGGYTYLQLKNIKNEYMSRGVAKGTLSCKNEN